jgi:AraC-like DNA-binding protein
MHYKTSKAESMKMPCETDALSHIIELLRPRAVQPKIITGGGSWAVRYERHEHAGFTLVLQGNCFLKVEGADCVELRAGDFFLLPRTLGFIMASHPDVEPRRTNPTPVRRVHHGSPAAQVSLRMLGGYFQFDSENAQLLLKLLPLFVHIVAREKGAARLRRLAQLIAEEASAERPGRDTIVERLVEVLLLEALRFRSSTAQESEQGLLAGLSDPALAQALRGMHVDLARRWTVAELAHVAGMSRAAFAERFTSQVGMPPMQYLHEWRMAAAKDLLRGERPPLSEVAERVGYQSASAFSTAFTRATGYAPSEFARVALSA